MIAKASPLLGYPRGEMCARRLRRVPTGGRARLQPIRAQASRDGGVGGKTNAADDALPNLLAPGLDPYDVLGVFPGEDDPESLKSAYRARLKLYHPDVYPGDKDQAEAITKRIVRAYEVLTTDIDTGGGASNSTDPFDAPEAEAEDVFVNEFACVGRNCSSCCVDRAPNAFAFASDTGAARYRPTLDAEAYDDLGIDPVVKEADRYALSLAVGQCPTQAIHWVTPRQRMALEELLLQTRNGEQNPDSVAPLIYELVTKAGYENGRYSGAKQSAKRTPKRSTEWVDWY